MPKLVTFSDPNDQYCFRGIFPSDISKKEILKAVEKKLFRHLRSMGLENDDFDMDCIAECTSIYNMKEGRFYEPDPSLGGIWND